MPLGKPGRGDIKELQVTQETKDKLIEAAHSYKTTSLSKKQVRELARLFSSDIPEEEEQE